MDRRCVPQSGDFGLADRLIDNSPNERNPSEKGPTESLDLLGVASGWPSRIVPGRQWLGRLQPGMEFGSGFVTSNVDQGV